MPADSQHERDDAAHHHRKSDTPAVEGTDQSESAPPDQWTALQQTYGNQWVARQIQRVSSRASASAGPAGGPLEDDLVDRIQGARSGGAALEPAQRAPAEQALGADLSAVRVHNDGASAALNEQLGARAFTVGRDIFFGAGASPADSDVLVHESAHAVQQGMGEEPPSAVGAADTSFEQAAESAASSAARLTDEDEIKATAARAVQSALEDAGVGQDNPEEVEFPSLDFGFDIPFPPPRDFSNEEIAVLVPGYQPPPEEGVPPVSPDGTAMALRTPTNQTVQRDDPHPSVDVAVQYPWSLQAALVYRDLNLRTFTWRLGRLDLIHEPQAQLTLSPDPQAWLASTLAVGLLNQHLQLMAEETEVQIAAQMTSLLAPQLSNSFGGNVQIEQHIWKGFSATFSVGGMWTPPRASDPGHLDWSTNAGLTVHLDGF